MLSNGLKNVSFSWMQLQKFIDLILIDFTSGALTTPVLKPNWNMPKMAVKIDKAKNGVTIAMILDAKSTVTAKVCIF